MAGRNHLPPNALKHREMPYSRAHAHPALIDDPRAALHHRRQLPPPPHPAVLEDRIATQHRDIQTLLVDNQRLAATHVALKQELSVAQQDLRHLSAAAADVKADRDTQVREVYEQAMKMEAEVRSIDAIAPELAQVRADVQKLTASRQELTAKFQAIESDLVRARSEAQQLPAIKAEIEAMHQEIKRGRAAVEYEKKTHASNLEHSQAMEKNMVSMAREIEKLRAELANAEKRARAAAAAATAATPSPGYAASYGNLEMVYGGSSYPDPYTMHQVQGGVDAGLQYATTGTIPHGVYDIQRTHLHR